MTTADAVFAACGDLDPRVVREFLARMDPDYLSLFGPEEIARHVRLSTRLERTTPALVEVTGRGERCFDVVVVGLDYFSLLSVVCGLLASFGLDIESGSVYTFGPSPSAAPAPGRRRPPRVSPKKIVDVFRVRLLPSEDGFGPGEAARLQEELTGLVRLLGDDRVDEARDRVNRRLAEHFERAKPGAGGVLYPVDVHFDNDLDSRWTIVDVDARDTPAFLYAVTNALAARGVYVQRVNIESRGRDVRDRFHVSDRLGRKIGAGADQEALRLAIVLAKQFTHVLPRAPDPAMATRHFDQLVHKLMESSSTPPAFLQQEQGLAALARLLGSSDFLWEDFLRMQFESLLPVLGELRLRGLRDATALEAELGRAVDAAKDHQEARAVLNGFKDREMFFIDMKHLLDPGVGIEAFSAALSDLAEAVLRESLRACAREIEARHGTLLPDGAPPRFAVCGLGKFGGREMGYASDLELLFLHDGTGRSRGPSAVPADEYYRLLADEMLRFVEARAEGIFRIDVRLRPYGRSGPLVSSMDQLRDYYRPDGPAEPFERQALIKLRRVAGDRELGALMEAHRDGFTYGGLPWDVSGAVHLRERQARELVSAGDVNLKYGPGGLLDVEYAVQYLQILHGHRHQGLRTPSTLPALTALREGSLVEPGEHDVLRAGYLFLRRAIEALRMVRGEAQDLVLPPPGSDGMMFLARRLGYSGRDWSEAAGRFAVQLQGHMDAVAALYDRRFGRARRGVPQPG